MKKFNHKHIIKKYSSEYGIERMGTISEIVNGRPVKPKENYKCLCALMDMNYEQQQNSSEFFIGDKIAYFIKSQDYTPKINDVLITKLGKKYILKEELDNEDLSDYRYFKARRVVDD